VIHFVFSKFFKIQSVAYQEVWFLVAVATGQGVITIVATLILELISKGGGGVAYAGNYIFWLATSATGLSILFSIIATNVAKPAVSSPKAGS
jgi:hypothetical protein